MNLAVGWSAGNWLSAARPLTVALGIVALPPSIHSPSVEALRWDLRKPMVLVTVKTKNKTGETWEAGDSVCKLSFGREGACPDR